MTDFSLRMKWLSRAAAAQERVKEEQEAVQVILDRMTSTSPNLSGMPGTHAPHDKMTDGIEKLSSARYRMNRARYAFRHIRNEVYHCIMQSPIRDEEKRLLVLMYLHGAKNADAAKALGKTAPGITYLHRRAVSRLTMPPGWHTQL